MACDPRQRSEYPDTGSDKANRPKSNESTFTRVTPAPRVTHMPAFDRRFGFGVHFLGFFFAPVAWLIGIPWHEAKLVGNLLGTRTVLNELVAYTNLGAQKSLLSPRSFTITTFALCGFANLSSIGIQIGGIGALAPNRRNDLARLGLRAMLAGTMANLMSASIVSMLIK